MKRTTKYTYFYNYFANWYFNTPEQERPIKVNKRFYGFFYFLYGFLCSLKYLTVTNEDATRMAVKSTLALVSHHTNARARYWNYNKSGFGTSTPSPTSLPSLLKNPYNTCTRLPKLNLTNAHCTATLNQCTILSGPHSNGKILPTNVMLFLFERIRQRESHGLFQYRLTIVQ